MIILILGFFYQTAVIQEILRLSSSAAGFFPRIAPPGGFTFKSHYIPGGVGDKSQFTPSLTLD